MVEGAKSVDEVLRSDFAVEMLVASPEFVQSVESWRANIQIFEAKPTMRLWRLFA